ncbi:hypothetical protein AB1L88_15855 [Tautonia sp. JC769]|uniref:hypothetical protein n=1 Tax=Tautonia sp. JC769 TaxID=3232135 RepID=UPI0034589EAE
MKGWICGVEGRLVTVSVDAESPVPTADLVGSVVQFHRIDPNPAESKPVETSWSVYSKAQKVGIVWAADAIAALGRARRQYPNHPDVVVSPDSATEPEAASP